MVREVLWEQMKEARYGGKMLRLIQRMYDENEGSFQLGGGGGGGLKGGDWGGVRGWGRGALCLPFCLQYISGRQ